MAKDKKKRGFANFLFRKPKRVKKPRKPKVKRNRE